MEGLLKYNYATADATGVAHDNIDNILVGNRQDKLTKMIEREGSISALPYFESEEGKQTLFETAMGAAFPGSAIGRVSKAAVTGGQSLKGSIRKLFDGFAPPQNTHLLKDQLNKGLFKGEWKDKVNQTLWDNKVSGSRMAMEKAFNKFGIKHNQTVNDPITETLRALKHRKN